MQFWQRAKNETYEKGDTHNNTETNNLFHLSADNNSRKFQFCWDQKKKIMMKCWNCKLCMFQKVKF